MSRASNIYVIEKYCSDEVWVPIAAFTVKWEAQDWLENKCEYSLVSLRAKRFPDGRYLKNRLPTKIWDNITDFLED